MIERIVRIGPMWPRVEAESPAEKGKHRKNPTNPLPKSRRHEKRTSDEEDQEMRPAHVDVRV